MSFGFVSISSPIDVARAKWGELPSIREVVISPLMRVGIPISVVAQRALNVYKVFFPNEEEGVSFFGTMFSHLGTEKLVIALPTCLSDLKNAVERVYCSLSFDRTQSALYYGLFEMPKAAAVTALTFSGLFQKFLPAELLTNYLAFLPSLGVNCMFMLFILGILSNSYHSLGKKEFEETLSSVPKSQSTPSQNAEKTNQITEKTNQITEETDQPRSVKKLAKFFGLEEIESDLIQGLSKSSDWNAVFSEKWESQKIAGYLAQIVFGEELLEETPESRAHRLQEKKESFIRWTNLECYKAVAEWLGVDLVGEDLLPDSNNPIQIKRREITPETLGSRAELLVKIMDACFKTTVATYFKNTTSTLSTAASFALIFYAKLFAAAAVASICLLLLAILQIRESQAQEFLVSLFQDSKTV